jgi:hemerythrin-like domain-containing protein
VSPTGSNCFSQCGPVRDGERVGGTPPATTDRKDPAMTIPTTSQIDMTVMHALHDAFRRDLDLLTRAASRLGDDPRAEERIRIGWQILADQLHHHHTVEDDQLWPLVRSHWSRRSTDALEVLDAMEAEHELVDPALAAVGEAVRTERHPGEALDALHGIVRDHLEHEEREAMPLIARVVSARDWDAFGAKQARSLGMKGAAELFPWLLFGADDVRTEKVLGVLPAPLRWAYRRRWEPRWSAEHAALFS